MEAYKQFFVGAMFLQDILKIMDLIIHVLWTEYLIFSINKQTTELKFIPSLVALYFVAVDSEADSVI